MTYAGNLRAFHQRHAEFFPQFSRKCSLRRFALSDFAARKFPLERRAIAFPALAYQQPPVATLNHRRHYGYHLSAFSASLRYRFLGFSWPVRFCGCSTFHNSCAPCTKGVAGEFSTSSLITCTRRFRIAGTSLHTATL